ncbi:MAG: amino acid adenylation domain-containing protein [Nostoc sp.]|uniref:amino acid adenylation domain-containing protein n=1 Tax=Nostoc sp. TaxID=1180 RepID=UPI002FF114E0
MKIINQFLSYLSSLEIKLRVDGDRLYCNAPQGILTSELSTQIRERKIEILKYIHDSIASTSTIEQIQPVSRDVDLPLSFGQQRLWFLNQLEPNSATYNLPYAVRLTGTLNVQALEQSLNEIVQRHEILRTTFMLFDGEPIQVINPTLSLKLSVVDLQEYPIKKQEAEVLRLAVQESQLLFNLAQGPLLRTTLLQLSKQQHVLLFTMHHIVSDGWSMGLLVKEVTALYEAFCQEKPSPLAKLPIQYADFAVWQRQWLQGEVLQSQISYWRKQLEDAPRVLDLPADYPRSAIQTFRGATYSFELSQELSVALNKLSQQQRCTLFMTLLAAFQTLLWRYTSSEDIVVGSPIANRNRDEIEGLIGFFVNTLVLRTNLAGNPTFEELLVRVREMTLGAYTHENLPFELLVEELQPERNLSHTPLFQVMFVLQNAPNSALELPGLTLTSLTVQNSNANFDLTLDITETAEKIFSNFNYNSNLFKESTIKRMAGHFQTLLKEIIANPKLRLSELSLITEHEKRQLLLEWNNTKVEYPQQQCIHELFETQVERTPDAIAVVFEDQQLTYHELNTRANQLAHYLQQLGVKPEVLVGICVERSLSMVIGLLAILKAGGAYIPLDPYYPPERLAFILQDAQISVLLTQQYLIENLPQHQTRIVCLDRDWASIAQQNSQNLINECTTDNLAYIIYTSGSTGQPKGVLVNHSNVVRLFAATQSWYNFNQDDVWTLFHSIAFDFSVWEIWGALLYGGKLVVVPYWLSRSPEDFYKLLVTQQVTVLNQTPSAFCQLIQAEESFVNIDKLSLRTVIFGGEALQLESLRPWFERHGDQFPQLVNMYGITETTVHVTYRPLAIADLEVASGSVIGRPIPDLQIYLLDKYQQPVPIGIPGEMYIGGAGVVRGYLNRPELTPEKFIPNPFSNKANARLYKSGDLGRYLPNGDIEYLGRIDHQVKVRGFRIELGEIEAIISQYPAVRETVVVISEQSVDSQRIVAYIVPQKEQTLTIPELRSFLEAKLPSYMIPAAFVTLEALPLTPNGKIDRKALPIPDTERPELDNTFVAPGTPNEKILAEIWAKVLSIKQVGIHDNFFSLGGDSIRSIQVQSLAREKGLSFSIQHLFQHQTISQLAKVLKTTELDVIKSEKSQPFSLISQADKQKLPDEIEDAYPLSMLQMGMVFHSEYSLERTTYHDIFSYHLQATLDIQILQAAIQLLVNNHAVLRTSFQLTDFSEPLQLVHRNIDVPLEVEDWRHLSTSELEYALNDWLEEEKRQHFDWSIPPLLRFFVHHCNEETFYLAVSFHHAILDGWSVASMLTELFGHYFSLLGEKVDFLNPPPSSLFRDFIALERETIATEESQRYWMQKLRDSTITTLPRWHSPEAIRQVNEQEVPISAEISEGLQQLAKSTKIPLKSVLLAAHLRVLSLLCGQSDVLTGVVTNGRLEHQDGERVLGLFLNTVPFHLKLSGGTWIDLVQDVFKAEQEWLPHRRYPLAAIQKSLGGLPLFETAFNFTHFHVYQTALAGKNVQSLGGKFYEETNFPLMIDFNQNPKSLLVALSLKYDTSEFDLEQIKSISGFYARTLQAIVSTPQKRYELHELLSIQERHQLLTEWNNTQTSYPIDQCIHKLFEAQVECTPNAVAVVFENEQLTYHELNAKANQLAHYLRSTKLLHSDSLGVKSEVLVGICVERSLYMIIGLLGILKAGGAYIPLDPSYPQERLAYMLEDSQPTVLLTQQQLLEVIPTHKAKVVCLDNNWELIAQHSKQNPNCHLSSDNLAYVIYTSGSTGKPKGAMNTHVGICNRLLWMQDTYQLTATDRVLQKTPFSFDVSVWEFFWPLITGARLIIAQPEGHRDPNYLVNVITQQQITTIHFVPSMLQAFLEAENLESCQSLIRVIVSGEALTTQLQERFFNRLNAQLHNLYGPTEAAVDVTFWQCKNSFTNQKTVPIGHPIANTQIYLLDRHLNPVPIGITGELYIGGVGVGWGYLNRPELTAEKFIPNPFLRGRGQGAGGRGQGAGEQREKEQTDSSFLSPVPNPQSPVPNPQSPNSERLYKTGDLARYLPSGEIEYIGRIDYQVKIRGFRIELGEIEAIISQHLAVRETVVVVAESQRIVAYVVPQAKQILVISELRSFLEAKLPSYMMPAAFVLLEALPLTPNGKVDRKALIAPETARPELEAIYQPPQTEVEQTIAEIWQKVLQVEDVGIYDNFFELGGDSLLLLQVNSKLREIFQRDLSVIDLFRYPTINSLASYLNEFKNQQKYSDLTDIAAEKITDGKVQQRKRLQKLKSIKNI